MPDDALFALMDTFSMKLRRGQIKGSSNVATHTAELMRNIVASARKGDTAQNLMDSVRKAGRHLVQAHPLDMVIGNVVRRVLYFIREEYVAKFSISSSSSSFNSGSSFSFASFRMMTSPTTMAMTALSPFPSTAAISTITSTTTTTTASSSTTPKHQQQQQQQQQQAGSRSRLFADNDEDGEEDDEEADETVERVDDEFGNEGDEPSNREFSDMISVTSSTTELDITQQPSILTSVFRPAHLDYSKPVDIKSNVIDSIKDLIEEISIIYKAISDQATDHVHANEVILTCGFSHTVVHFLKALAKKRKFEVVIAEHSPDFNGQKSAEQLSREGIETTLVPDSAIFAMMARVNKVLIGTHAVMANGGLIAPCGTHMVALAAKQHSVPVVVCTGLYKLTPLYPVDQYSFNQHAEPSEIISLQDGAFVANVHVHNPAFDYIPPELVSLFITNQGGHNPSYIYRLLSEYYNAEDHVL